MFGNTYLENMGIVIKFQLFNDVLCIGSARGTVSVIGDIMGPALQNLDSLLKMPYGCGEQNMVNFAPDIYIMQYLTATNQVTETIREKAIGFMMTGNDGDCKARLNAFKNNLHSSRLI